MRVRSEGDKQTRRWRTSFKNWSFETWPCFLTTTVLQMHFTVVQWIKNNRTTETSWDLHHLTLHLETPSPLIFHWTKSSCTDSQVTLTFLLPASGGRGLFEWQAGASWQLGAEPAAARMAVMEPEGDVHLCLQFVYVLLMTARSVIGCSYWRGRVLRTSVKLSISINTNTFVLHRQNNWENDLHLHLQLA